MFGVILKAGLGFLKEAFAFVLANWRWILPLVLGLLLWRFIVSIQDERDDAIKALEQYQQDARDAVVQREIDNRQKEIAAKSAIDAIEVDHTQELETIRRNYALLNQTDKTAAAGSIALWRERVRLELQRQTANGLRDIPETAGEPAEVGGGCDAAPARKAYDNLELACAVTTSDYNALWDAWSKSCEIYGCR